MTTINTSEDKTKRDGRNLFLLHLLIGLLTYGGTLSLMPLFGGCFNRHEGPGTAPVVNRHFVLGSSTTPWGLSLAEMESRVDLSVAKIAEGADFYQAVALWSNINDPTAVSLFNRAITQAKMRNLKLALYLDVTQPNDRTKIALPPSVTPAISSWSDTTVKAAYKNFVLTLANAYQPAYLGIGVEMDVLYRGNFQEFQAFASISGEVARAVKASLPETVVFISVQYDRLVKAEPNVATLTLFDYLDPTINIGLSLYPWQIYSSSRDIPSNYLTRARATQKPIYISETSWPSVPISVGQNTVGNPQDQVAYVQWLIAEAAKGGIKGVTWWSVNDFQSPGDPIFALWGNQGMVTLDYIEKLSWTEWKKTFQLVFQ